jgi:hypothetical protein
VRIWVGAVLILCGCSKPGGAAPDAGAPQAAAARGVEVECTLQTPLVPGVPGSPGHLIPSPRNAQGDSELAALMRRMQTDLELARTTLLKGERPPTLYGGHRRIRCSWPTEVKDRNEAFDAFAVRYLEAVKALDAAQDKKPAFIEVVKACRACHEASCPGPISAIDQLQIPDGK